MAPASVSTDMTGFGGDHSLIAFKESIDDSSIGLGAAYQKEDFAFRTAAGPPDLSLADSQYGSSP